MALSLWLASQPLWFAATLAIGFGVLFSAVGTLIVNTLYTPLEIAQNTATGGVKYEFLSQIYAVVLGLLLVGEYERYNELELGVHKEAKALEFLVQTAAVFPDADRALVREATAAYVEAVTGLEWPAMARGQASPEADRALGNLIARVLAVQPVDDRGGAAYGHSLSLIETVKALRTERLARVSGSLTILIWYVLIVSTGVALVFTWYFGDAAISNRIFFSSMVATVIMTEFMAIWRLNYPFTGDIAIRPEPFLKIASLAVPL